MIAFLNERSLEQHANWSAALRLFWEATLELSGEAELYRDSSFFLNPEFKERFGPALAGVPKELRPLVRQVAFSERYWKCWRATRISEGGEFYSCHAPHLAMSDESLCEASERKLRQPSSEVGMLSAGDSTFANVRPLALTNDISKQVVELHNSDSIEAVRQWIAEQRGHFDPSANLAPRDFQTVLEKDPTRFRRTGRFQHVAGKDRRIYEEIKTGRQFYVDEGHPGHSAHLEVCDANGNHLGVADINTGVLDDSGKVNGRGLNK